MDTRTVDEFNPDFAGPAEWAVMYRSYGLQIVPGHMPSEHQNWKRPGLADWKPLQDEIAPDFTFERWYGASGEHCQRQNMGLITGRASGNVFVIDIDDHKTLSALNWWHGVLEVHNHGLEPDTWHQLTGGGGRQLFFRAPPGWRAPTNKTGIGVDIRGQGGFAVLPPSRHDSGRGYIWKAGCAPWECEVADAPDWLLEAVSTLVERFGGHQGDGPSERTASPITELDAFGSHIDGRDHYMRDMIWAMLITEYRLNPTYPDETTIQFRMSALYEVYERKVKSRLTGPDLKSVLLDREGRGRAAFEAKYRYALKKWDTGIKKEAAAEPRGNQDYPFDIAKKEGDAGAEGNHPPASAVSRETQADIEPGPVNVGDLNGEPNPRKWVAQDWIPEGVISSLSGDGGMGKTLLAQQLLYAAGVGGKWLGIEIAPRRGLGVFCEDDEDELHRRHIAIKADMGHAIGNPFTDTWIWPRVGYDNLLVTFDRENKPSISPFFARVLAEVMDKKINLLILDTIADLFGGNEIIRAQVNYFIKATCGAFIKKAKEAGFTLSVLLLSHPSQAGRNSGSGESGSTAWNNAVRARLYLTRPEDGLPQQRTLTRKKSNYSASGDDVRLDLLWADGVLKPASSNNAVAVKSIENQIIQMVAQAWDDDRPYHAKKGEGMRFLDGEVVKFFAGRVAVEVVISALANLKHTGAIEVARKGEKRGYKVR